MTNRRRQLKGLVDLDLRRDFEDIETEFCRMGADVTDARVYVAIADNNLHITFALAEEYVREGHASDELARLVTVASTNEHGEFISRFWRKATKRNAR